MRGTARAESDSLGGQMCYSRSEGIVGTAPGRIRSGVVSREWDGLQSRALTLPATPVGMRKGVRTKACKASGIVYATASQASRVATAFVLFIYRNHYQWVANRTDARKRLQRSPNWWLIRRPTPRDAGVLGPVFVSGSNQAGRQASTIARNAGRMRPGLTRDEAKRAVEQAEAGLPQEECLRCDRFHGFLTQLESDPIDSHRAGG